jgi:hypothetical protein
MPFPRRLLSFGVALLSLCATVEAHAQQAEFPLQYEAPVGCPDQAQFVELVRQRLSPSDSEPALRDATLIVGIAPSEQSYEGTLRMRTPEGLTGERRVDNAECAQVADALAAVAAVALRERAQAAGDSPSTAPAAEPPAAEPPQAESEKKRVRHVIGSRPDWISNEIGKTHFETEVPAGKLSVDAHTTLGLQGGVAFGLLPGVVVPRYDLSVYSVLSLTTPGQAPVLLGVMPRLRLSFLGPSEKMTRGTRTELLGAEYHMGMCGTPYYDTEGLVLLGCVEYGGSALGITSTSPDGSKSEVPNAGSGLISVTLDAGYRFGSAFEVALRVGGTSRVDGGRDILDANGDRLFTLGGNFLFTTLGFGLHW